MLQPPLCSESISIYSQLIKKLGEFISPYDDYVVLGKGDSITVCLQKELEVQDLKQELENLVPIEFEGQHIHRAEKEILSLIMEELGPDLKKYTIDNYNIASLDLNRSEKAPEILYEVMKHLESFEDLQKLYCGSTRITELPPLPESLQTLSCSFTPITELPPLPDSLQDLDCTNAEITELPPLPNGLKELKIGLTKITKLPEKLPDSLEYFACHYTKVSKLPEKLPDGLKELKCNNTQITELPKKLPESLEGLYCNNIQITELPKLPDSLKWLECQSTPAIKDQKIIDALEEFKEKHPLADINY